MKNKSKYLILPLVILPISVPSCVSNQNVDNDSNIVAPLLPNVEFKYKNYFKNSLSESKANDLKNELKQRITKIINDYRLKEWNQYYESNKYEKEKSHVFDAPRLNEFKNSTNNSFYIDKSMKEKFQQTKIYEKQDNQFRYFNDFINIMHDEGKKPLEQPFDDFLYLRWELLSIDASVQYNKVLNSFGKKLSDISVDDWVLAITESTTGSFQKIGELLMEFAGFYGFSISLKQELQNDKQNSVPTIKIDYGPPSNKGSIVPCLIAAKDYYMRLATKPSTEKEWSGLKERVKKILELSETKYSLWINSLKGEPDFGTEGTNGPISQGLKLIINFVETALDQIVSIQDKTYKFSDYYNTKE